MARVEQELKWTTHPLNLSPMISASSSRLKWHFIQKEISDPGPHEKPGRALRSFS